MMVVVDNTLIKLLKHFPDKPWDWSDLSSNPNINISFVKENLDKPWNWFKLSSNTGITLEDIVSSSNSTLPWNWVGISNITIEFIKKHLNRLIKADDEYL